MNFDDFKEISFTDNIDNLILMHRDAHFQGDFRKMLKYYHEQGKGVNPYLEESRILELAELQEESKGDLSHDLLSGEEMEMVARSVESYEKLRKLAASKDESKKKERLIALMILSEDPHPEALIEEIVQEKGAIVPQLIDLIKAEDAYNPLFPGYGHAPALAAECLGKIGDKRALISLFEAIGAGDVFDEDTIVQALHRMGSQAKEFLLRVLKSRPINEDNDRAAVALLAFKEDEEVAEQCLAVLYDAEIRKHVPLCTYLILVCEGLKRPESRNKFSALAQDKDISSLLKKDIETIESHWSSVH